VVITPEAVGGASGGGARLWRSGWRPRRSGQTPEAAPGRGCASGGLGAHEAPPDPRKGRRRLRRRLRRWECGRAKAAVPVTPGLQQATCLGGIPTSDSWVSGPIPGVWIDSVRPSQAKSVAPKFPGRDPGEAGAGSESPWVVLGRERCTPGFLVEIPPYGDSSVTVHLPRSWMATKVKP
jgi:hypothetical protein